MIVPDVEKREASGAEDHSGVCLTACFRAPPGQSMWMIVPNEEMEGASGAQRPSETGLPLILCILAEKERPPGHQCH